MKHLTILISIISFITLLKSCSNTEQNNNYETTLNSNWHIQSAANLDKSAEEISVLNYDASKWYNAKVPGTILGNLVQQGVYKDPYFAKNILKIKRKQFRKAWLYRNEFELSEKDVQRNVSIGFDGINYSANIYLNGNLIAKKDNIYGAFRRFKLNISKYVKPNKNCLVIELFPPKPGDFTIGFVDWNPKAPDENMGLWRPVTLYFSNKVSIENPFVKSDIDLENMRNAKLSVTLNLKNHNEENIKGFIDLNFQNKILTKSVEIKANENKLITLTSEDFEELNVKDPKLWWPANLGDPNLYNLDINFRIGQEISDKKSITFGIRSVEDYFTEDGYRGYKINGKKVLIKGGGWVDDLLLNDTHESIETQIKYVKDMNLNTIRIEGFWGKDHKLYDLCDENGILIMAGWSCHWEHEEYVGKVCDDFGGITTPEEMDLIAESLEDQILYLRNHPSIFVWFAGSDKLPRPELERKYIEVFNRSDKTRPYLAAAEELISEVSGPTGVKMNGPYAYTPPNYWYEDTLHGGAFGFNTETGPGPQIPTLESIKKMIPEDHLWPIDHIWEYHCGRNNFNTLDRFQKAITERFGKSESLEDFVQKAQLLNYELMRPMFESFTVNRAKTTGLIQWMINSAWPEMYWQLYDSYLIPTSAYYGAKNGAKPLHVMYNYGDKSIYVVNENYDEFYDLKAKISVYDINSNEIFSESVTFDILENVSKRIFPESLINLSKLNNDESMYFLDLRLFDEERKEVDINLYWLSKKEDVLDYQNTDWCFTPTKEYADFTSLSKMIKVSLNTSSEIITKGNEQYLQAIIENPTKNIAFFIEMQLSDKSIIPVLWEDNYITLLPGEKRVIKVNIDEEYLGDSSHKIICKGWNIK